MKHTFADTLINMMIRLNQVKVERGGLSTSFSLSFAIYCIDGNKLRLINMKDVIFRVPGEFVLNYILYSIHLLNGQTRKITELLS